LSSSTTVASLLASSTVAGPLTLLMPAAVVSMFAVVAVDEQLGAGVAAVVDAAATAAVTATAVAFGLVAGAGVASDLA